ncbi:unnamed protein product [Brassicogethes aeneus]|uniref:Uncharacterized protein n=1 Tax=Brassicogethes aeneus TaxID=1431903 RepID=A0A9P0F9B2_BRAAE|nr:unnamed protein product [Brassicogethes aeneus]
MDTIFKVINKCILIIILTKIQLSMSKEEPHPELYLAPRNFNPHPYEHGATSAQTSGPGNGPVLFPRTPEDEEDNNKRQNNIITIPKGFVNKNAHPVDNHPYSRVVKKNKYKLVGKYHNRDSKLNPVIAQALGRHAAKVLSRPADKLKDDYDESYPVQKENHNYNKIFDQNYNQNYDQNYAFAYKVVDAITGDDFSHRQSQNDKATKGEYRVKLPDGRLQVVSYTADHDGYKAEVTYTNDHYSQNILPQDNVQIQKIPVRQIQPHQQKLYTNYYDVNQPIKQNQVVFVTEEPPHQDIEYSNYVTPRPGDIFLPQNIVDKGAIQPKVQIITTNPRDYHQSSYIPVTVAPPLYYSTQSPIPYTTPAPFIDTQSNYIASTISPLVINNGNHGHIVPKTREDYEIQNKNFFLVTTVAPSTVPPNELIINGARYSLLKGHRLANLNYKKK